MTGNDTCRCGHGHEAHEHYRPGADCALCADCVTFRTATPWWSRLPQIHIPGLQHAH